MGTFYTIYKTTNKINGKIYIGKHQTNVLNDSYFGSGKLLLAAIEKYGITAFEKQILFLFDNEQEMNAKEAELVTEEFCLREDTYNLCLGGKGGFGYINRNGLNTTGVSKRDYAAIAMQSVATRLANGYVVSEETKKKISKANELTNEARGHKVSLALKGKEKPKEVKDKLSKALKEHFKENRPKFPNRKKREPVVFKEIQCPHCLVVGKSVGMKRWHFDNCQMR